MRPKNFVHTLDKSLSEKIFQTDDFRNMTDKIQSNELDEVCAYVYSASLPEIVDDSLHEMARLACDTFDIAPVKLYLKRSYDFDVTCGGYNKPVIILPAALLEQNDREIIQSRLFAAAGAVAANHHKLAFLIWAAENLGGVATFPLVGEVVRGFFYEWARARQFTLDRAVLSATNDLPLTLKNILYGVVPFDVLKNFSFGSDDDTFLEQTRRYLKNDTPAQMLGQAFSFFSDYAWLPRRYEEIKNFYRGEAS